MQLGLWWGMGIKSFLRNKCSGKYVIFIILIAGVVLPALLFEETIFNYNREDQLTKSEQFEIKDISSELCLLDPQVCDQLENGRVKFFVERGGVVSFVLSVFGFGNGGYARAHGDGHLIVLHENLFLNRKEAVTVMYHEMMHVNHSDFSFFVNKKTDDKYGETFETCLEHNNVKKLTQVFFYRLVTSGRSEYQEHLDIARGSSGNAIDNCDAYL